MGGGGGGVCANIYQNSRYVQSLCRQQLSENVDERLTDMYYNTEVKDRSQVQQTQLMHQLCLTLINCQNLTYKSTLLYHQIDSSNVLTSITFSNN